MRPVDRKKESPEVEDSDKLSSRTSEFGISTFPSTRSRTLPIEIFEIAKCEGRCEEVIWRFEKSFRNSGVVLT
jgi:hypothetical protein